MINEITPVKYYPLIIFYVILLHVMWATCVLFDANALHATALSPLGHAFGSNYIVAGVLFLVSSISIVGVLPPTPTTVLMLMPQQAVLSVCASSSVLAAVNGSFADGILRPIAFIAADQAAIILIAAVHMFAVARLAVHMNLKL